MSCNLRPPYQCLVHTYLVLVYMYSVPFRGPAARLVSPMAAVASMTMLKRKGSRGNTPLLLPSSSASDQGRGTDPPAALPLCHQNACRTRLSRTRSGLESLPGGTIPCPASTPRTRPDAIPSAVSSIWEATPFCDNCSTNSPGSCELRQCPLCMLDGHSCISISRTSYVCTFMMDRLGMIQPTSLPPRPRRLGHQKYAQVRTCSPDVRCSFQRVSASSKWQPAHVVSEKATLAQTARIMPSMQMAVQHATQYIQQ